MAHSCWCSGCGGGLHCAAGSLDTTPLPPVRFKHRGSMKPPCRARLTTKHVIASPSRFPNSRVVAGGQIVLRARIKCCPVVKMTSCRRCNILALLGFVLFTEYSGRCPPPPRMMSLSPLFTSESYTWEAIPEKVVLWKRGLWRAYVFGRHAPCFISRAVNAAGPHCALSFCLRVFAPMCFRRTHCRWGKAILECPSYFPNCRVGC